MENFKENRIILGGDIHIRIGILGDNEEEKDTERKNQNKVIGNDGRKFIELMQESGLNVLNEKTSGDCEREFTYVETRGCTVIDYIFVNDLV